MRTFHITPLTNVQGENIRHQDEWSERILHKIDNLNKPKGSLGMLETLAFQICKIQHTLSPKLIHPCHLLLGADHGIEREGVSVSPRAVTWQQMINFTRGGGGVNLFCRQHGFELTLVDVGVDHDLTAYSDIVNRKIARGTNNFLWEPAMSTDAFNRAIEIGVELVDECKQKGCNIVCVGEMGVGNTSASSIWMSLFGQLPLNRCVGSGSGLNQVGKNHKLDVLSRAVDRFRTIEPERNKAETIIRYFGGFEMVVAVGAMLRAAELRQIILVDGFIMSACLFAASRLNRSVIDYAVFGHCSGENGHGEMLRLMHARPILNLDMRLGEGTGALCAYPIVESAVRMMNEMNNFKDANIDKYF